MGVDYARAKSAAVALLLRQSPALPVDVLGLRHERAVRFETVQRFCALTNTTREALAMGSDCLRDGCSLFFSRGGVDQVLVLYDGSVRNAGRRNFTLAHELGHIYLGHRSDGEDEEREANCFAAQLLVPDVLLRRYIARALRPVTGAEIAGCFGVSREMAGNRLREIMHRPPRAVRGEGKLAELYGGLLPWSDEPTVGF